MAAHEYRDAYFGNPSSWRPNSWASSATRRRRQIEVRRRDFAGHNRGPCRCREPVGLGDQVKVSALIERVQDGVLGRMLVFFPGEVEGNNYRLLGARDGWNYLATLITAEEDDPNAPNQ